MRGERASETRGEGARGGQWEAKEEGSGEDELR